MGTSFPARSAFMHSALPLRRPPSRRSHATCQHKRLSDKRILVTGATGPTGRLICAALHQQGAKVRAFIRLRTSVHCRERVDSIREICPNVDFCMGDLRDSETVRQAVQGCQGVISASGTRNFEGGDPNRPEMVDFLGVRCLAESFFDAQLEEDLLMMLSEDIGDEGEIGNDGNGANSVDMERPVMTNEPQVSGASRFVLLSSLGVTRPERFPQLQQMGSMMTYKLYGEETLRQCGCPYTIVRPGGLTDSPGRKARLLIDQGDRIAGSISRQDVAEICVEALFRDNATNMTFECVAQPGVAGNGFTPAMFSQLLPDES